MAERRFDGFIRRLKLGDGAVQAGIEIAYDQIDAEEVGDTEGADKLHNSQENIIDVAEALKVTLIETQN